MPNRVALCGRIKQALPKSYSTKLFRGSDETVDDWIEIYRDGQPTYVAVVIGGSHLTIRGTCDDVEGLFATDKADQMVDRLLEVLGERHAA